MANNGIKFNKYVFNNYVTYLESVDYVLSIFCHKIFLFHADEIEADNKKMQTKKRKPLPLNSIV